MLVGYKVKTIKGGYKCFAVLNDGQVTWQVPVAVTK